jgi:2-polyprenyl-3-methyl-5-hydroxy-6-metoxy-1,4-benzoquinol methylase
MVTSNQDTAALVRGTALRKYNLPMSQKNHWENIHQTKTPAEVSWYQEHSLKSLEYIAGAGIDLSGRIIDIGGGISTLVDDLLAQGYLDITVLDISLAALQTAQQRLGARAKHVTWLEADILQVKLPHQAFDLWHDRAVFHFLTEAESRSRYVQTVKHTVKPGGHIIVATFASDGPERCSGLPVARYEPETLHSEFGPEFTLLKSERETHHTPFGTQQKFLYCYCRKPEIYE